MTFRHPENDRYFDLEEHTDLDDLHPNNISRTRRKPKSDISVEGATAQLGKYNNDMGSQTNIEINININVGENTSPKALADLENILNKIKEIRNG